MPGLVLKNISKSFDKTTALKDVSGTVALGEIVAVLGPSGCGKSTLLMIIAGLEKPDHGEVLWDNIDLANTAPHQRGFGLMFQDFALFPHYNVFDNVAFGLEYKRLRRPELENRVAETLALVGLPGFAHRDVNLLSGGEQQRVALARSLAPYPRLLMLDEPLGSLDRTLRERLVIDLRSLLKTSVQTALYVTHDQEEAFAIADRIMVLNAGQVEQVGKPEEIYRWPASPFVARFLGLENLLDGKIVSCAGELSVETVLGIFPLSTDEKYIPGEQVTMLFRPEALRLDADQPCFLTAQLDTISFRGGLTRAIVSVNGVRLSVDFPSPVILPQAGETLCLGYDPGQAVQIFKR